VDGTLAPIVPTPEQAEVPGDTKDELERLCGRYLLVGCLSGRPGDEAAAIVGVEGIRYVGNHGLELDPRSAELAGLIARFRDDVAGVWPIEDKGLSLSFHYRLADDQAAAEAVLQGVATRALEAGLEPRWGRKVLEVRPRGAADKGVAVKALLSSCGAELGLYAGDDTTDLDAFRGLVDAGLEHAVRIAVASAEVSQALLEEADLVVGGPPDLFLVLQAL
jgi:trehalose 6-phosphate phosphatase